MYGQFFILFGLILVGYYCNKKGYLPLKTNKNVGHMVMRVTIPAMLITTIASIEITDRVLRAFLLSAAVSGTAVPAVGFASVELSAASLVSGAELAEVCSMAVLL